MLLELITGALRGIPGTGGDTDGHLRTTGPGMPSQIVKSLLGILLHIGPISGTFPMDCSNAVSGV